MIADRIFYSFISKLKNWRNGHHACGMDFVTAKTKWGTPFDGSDATDGNRVLAANNDYSAIIVQSGIGNIPTIEEALNPGKAFLLADLRTRYQDSADVVARLADENVVSTSIYLNPDKETDQDRRSYLDARPYETGNYSASGANDVMIGLDQVDIMCGGRNCSAPSRYVLDFRAVGRRHHRTGGRLCRRGLRGIWMS